VALTGLVVAQILNPADLTLVDDSRVALRGPYTLALVAPAVDVFADPTAGWHLSTALGLLVAHGRIVDPVIDGLGGLGAAGSMALGYDGWVGEDWCVGGSARGLLGAFAGERSSGGTTARERAWVSSVGLTLTLLHH
jgi:hypothetical protein